MVISHQRANEKVREEKRQMEGMRNRAGEDEAYIKGAAVVACVQQQDLDIEQGLVSGRLHKPT